jgi:DNA gyrase subunit A
MAVRFSEDDIRPTGRNSTGVIGIRMDEKDTVVDAIISHESQSILTITENGYGKRTASEEYRHISRGGKGVINIITSERNGAVCAIKSVDEAKDIMLISKNGITIRTPVSGISIIGRNTQGVRLMNLKAGDKVVACTLVEQTEEKAEELV